MPLINILIAFGIALLLISSVATIVTLVNSSTTSSSKKDDKPKKVCVFDIDNTLTAAATLPKVCNLSPVGKSADRSTQSAGGDPAAPYAKEAIKRCRDKGYGVAIATAESKKNATSDKQKKFLRSIGWNEKTDPLYHCDLSKQGTSYTICADQKYQVVEVDGPTGTKKFKLVKSSTAGSVKKPMYENVAKDFNVDIKDLIIFDDDAQNLSLCKYLMTDDGNPCSENCDHCIQASTNCAGKWCPKGCGLTKQNFDIAGI